MRDRARTSSRREAARQIDITLRLASRAFEFKPTVPAVDCTLDGRAGIDWTAVRPHALVPALTGQVVRFADQSLALLTKLRRPLGEDVGHGTRLRKLLSQGFAISAGQRQMVGLAGHG
jgi:hypothetical protein